MPVKENLMMQITKWKERSELGECCGILGCGDKPIVQCPECNNWYCKKHSQIHLHAEKLAK
jgi:hypothetical protein